MADSREAQAGAVLLGNWVDHQVGREKPPGGPGIPCGGICTTSKLQIAIPRSLARVAEDMM